MGTYISKLLFQPPKWHGPFIHDCVIYSTVINRLGNKLSVAHLNLHHEVTVLYSHGNAEDLSSVCPWLLSDFCHRMQVNAVAYDYSGFGQSTGVPTEEAIFADAEAVYRFVREHLGIRPQNLIVMGCSLGTAPSVHLAACIAKRGFADAVHNAASATTYDASVSESASTSFLVDSDGSAGSDTEFVALDERITAALVGRPPQSPPRAVHSPPRHARDDATISSLSGDDDESSSAPAHRSTKSMRLPAKPNQAKPMPRSSSLRGSINGSGDRSARSGTGAPAGVVFISRTNGAQYAGEGRVLRGLILNSPLLSALRVAFNFRWSLPGDSFCSVDAIGAVETATLIVHGQNDEVVPFWHGIALFQAAKCAVRPLWLPTASHNDLMTFSLTYEILNDFVHSVEVVDEVLHASQL